MDQIKHSQVSRPVRPETKSLTIVFENFLALVTELHFRRNRSLVLIALGGGGGKYAMVALCSRLLLSLRHLLYQ